jgi:nitrogen fixation protein NifB
MIDISKHPCFNDAARHTHERVHLPVAPRCNVQCNFCNRKFDCASESRPGVSSALLSPAQALIYTRKLVESGHRLSVVGIAGPGDPFANAEETMETLRLIREEFPDMLLCVATNGLAVLPYVHDLAVLKVSHVSITVNALVPSEGAKIYAWVRDNRKLYRGEEGAALLWERQAAAIAAIRRENILLKINTIVLPGINDASIGAIAQTMTSLGATIMNCIPMYPVAGAEFEFLPEPTSEMMHRVRGEAGRFISLMNHCTRCRADAAGLLGGQNSTETVSLLQACAALPLDGSDNRVLAAAASREGELVNQHLGHAERFWIYKKTPEGFEFVEHRKAPPAGTGDLRWAHIAKTLSDCHVLLVENAGNKPRILLEKNGLKIISMTGLIDDGLEAVFSGEPLPAHLTNDGCRSCARVSACTCGGDGSGCGG